MPYTKQQWHDDTTTAPYGPINGTRLNYIETGIETAQATAESAGGGAGIGTALPLIDGTASAGVGTVSSAVDHVHPTDTSRAPLASPTFTGSPVLPTGTTATTQTAGDSSTKLATTAFTTTASSGKQRVIDLGDPSWGVIADSGTTNNGPLIMTAAATLTHGGVMHLPGNQASNYSTNSPIILKNGVRLVGDGAFAGNSISIGPSYPGATVNGAQTTPASQVTTFTLTINSGGTLFPLGSSGITLTSGVGVISVVGPTTPIIIYYTGTTGTTFTGCQTNETNVTIANGAAVSVPLVWLGEPGGLTVQGTRLESVQLGGGATAASCLLHSCQANENSGFYDINFSNFKLMGCRFDDGPGGAPAQARNYECRKMSFYFNGTPHSVAVGFDARDSGTPTAGTQRGVSDITTASLSGSNITVLSAVRLNGVTGDYSKIHCENTPHGVMIGDSLATGPITVRDVTAQPNAFTDLVSIGNHAGNIVDIRNICWLQAPSTQVLVTDSLNSKTTSSNQIIGQYRLDRSGIITTDSSAVSSAIRSSTTATTQSANDNSTKVATTAYADTGLALKANLASPTFTGSPVLPTGTTGVTQAATDSSTALATTAYVMLKERAFTLGKGGAVAATDTNAADFPLAVPFDCTLLRMKVTLKSAATGSMVVQLRKAAATITTAPAYSDVTGFVVTFSSTNVLAVVDPANVNLGEGDFLNFSCTTGSGSNILVECVVVLR